MLNRSWPPPHKTAANPIERQRLLSSWAWPFELQKSAIALRGNRSTSGHAWLELEKKKTTMALH
jgi:hypothetical protein